MPDLGLCWRYGAQLNYSDPVGDLDNGRQEAIALQVENFLNNFKSAYIPVNLMLDNLQDEIYKVLYIPIQNEGID